MVNGGVPEGSMARSPGALIAPALARGDSSVENMIDWDSLRVAGNSVGMAYKLMPNAQEKAAFRTSFVSEFWEG